MGTGRAPSATAGGKLEGRKSVEGEINAQRAALGFGPVPLTRPNQGIPGKVEKEQRRLLAKYEAQVEAGKRWKISVKDNEFFAFTGSKSNKNFEIARVAIVRKTRDGYAVDVLKVKGGPQKDHTEFFNTREAANKAALALTKRYRKFRQGG